MVSQILDMIHEEQRSRSAQLETARKNGKKVIGWLGYNIPEEIIHALGMIPVRLGKGGDDRLVERGARYVSTQNCVFVREIAGLFAENKDPFITNCDAVLVDSTCMQLYRLAEVLRHYFKIKTFILGVPRSFEREAAREYYIHEIEGLVHELEEYSGYKLKEKELVSSVALYNNIREVIRELYQYSGAGNSPVRWRDMYHAALAGYALDRASYLSLLQKLLTELKIETSTGDIITSDKETRIFLSGSVIAPGDIKLIDIIERSNGTIVGDDLWSGLAPFLRIKVQKPTIRGIAEGYMNRVPHATQPCSNHAADVRMQNLKQMVRDYDADGVIYHTLRYCDSFTLRTAHVRNSLKDAGIPLLDIHTEYAGSDFESIRTRVEAFMELLEANQQPGEVA
jgi:benzoyl-CoA reductase/2-hydroxyglutaryl-CoA dehydratase subunit BcrC/BadD/HgdB